ncbi:cation/multidrug efflux pump [gamma proteobacterium HIMB55]|nr:cation/multidrug efflux pump [gamma proteobacterium HIMB55]
MNGPITWFIKNPIAGNLLMVLLIIGGFASIPKLDKQFFPTPEINQIEIRMEFRGASPSEVEEQISVRIEEAIHDLNGIEELRSTSREGLATVMVEVESDYPTQKLTNDINTRVDAIRTFPSDAERPTVTELTYRHQMGRVQIYGDLSEREMKQLGETLRDELVRQPWVSIVELQTARPYEVSIEVSEDSLQRYQISFDQLANAVRQASINLPAGSVKRDSGDLLIQTRGQAYDRADFESIVLRSDISGQELLLSDVATVKDTFEDVDVDIEFNGQRSLGLNVYVTTSPDVILTTDTVKAWVAERSQTLPEGVSLEFWQDPSKSFKERVRTLVSNGLGGLVLVIVVLMLFLRPMLAFWVSVGIVVAYMGTLFVLPYTGQGLNMISLFAFLLTLGIVVDDAIIVGESVHSAQSRGLSGEHGALVGARQVVKPVIFAVISTMVFFAPMFFLPGEWGPASMGIPVVVCLALAFSLIESLLILPSHLAHMKPEPEIAQTSWLGRTRRACADGLSWFANDRYRPFLEKCLRNHAMVGGFFLVMLCFSLALFGGGYLKSAFFPRVNSDFVVGNVEMPQGGAFSDTQAMRDRMIQAAEEIKDSYNAQPRFAETGAIDNILGVAGGNKIDLVMQTVNDDLDTEEVAKRLRERLGDLSEAKDVRFDYTIRDPGKPITLQFASDSIADLELLADDVRASLERYPGVFDISDSFDAPLEELVLSLKPAAENLGISLADVARQIRQAFYGEEVQRIPRDGEDIRVMVRYPEAERRAIANINSMYIRTSDGREVPFSTVAAYRVETGYQSIERVDRLRTLEVAADVADDGAPPRAIVESILQNDAPTWLQMYPGLSINMDGELQEEIEFQQAMVYLGMLSMLVIFGLMAVAFKSYWQPFLVLTAVPFGLMGAIFGHWILGWQVSMFSIMGVIACAGVVVNDNLVLIDRINNLRAEGLDLESALLQGATDRFRPIILTSVTTFVGLIPIMLETSVQAQFLIPMVVSLSFGVMFATGVTLVLVPALYLLGDDIGKLFGTLSRRGPKALAS